MSNRFFEHPILNSPYEIPPRHWELDSEGQPTQQILETRRRAEFITPIPKPKKRKPTKQKEIVFDEGIGLSTQEQQYDLTSNINEVRSQGTGGGNCPPHNGKSLRKRLVCFSTGGTTSSAASARSSARSKPRRLPSG